MSIAIGYRRSLENWRDSSSFHFLRLGRRLTQFYANSIPHFLFHSATTANPITASQPSTINAHLHLNSSPSSAHLVHQPPSHLSPPRRAHTFPFLRQELLLKRKLTYLTLKFLSLSFPIYWRIILLRSVTSEFKLTTMQDRSRIVFLVAFAPVNWRDPPGAVLATVAAAPFVTVC